MLIVLGDVVNQWPSRLQVSAFIRKGEQGIYSQCSFGAEDVSDDSCETIARQIQHLTENFLMRRHFGPGIPDWNFVLKREDVRRLIDDSRHALIIVVNDRNGDCPGSSSPGSTVASDSELLEKRGSSNLSDEAGEGPKQFALRSHERIVGTLLIATYHALTGIRARLEDFVVDPVASGQQWGRKMLETGKEFSRSQCCVDLQLTCAPFRAQAQHLYRSSGFDERHSTILAMYL